MGAVGLREIPLKAKGGSFRPNSVSRQKLTLRVRFDLIKIGDKFRDF